MDRSFCGQVGDFLNMMSSTRNMLDELLTVCVVTLLCMTGIVTTLLTGFGDMIWFNIGNILVVLLCLSVPGLNYFKINEKALVITIAATCLFAILTPLATAGLRVEELPLVLVLCPMVVFCSAYGARLLIFYHQHKSERSG